MEIKVKDIAPKPFPHLVIPHFLPQGKIRELLSSLKKEQFALIESDLFTMWQTSELKHSPQFSSLVEIFISQPWKEKMERLFGIKISSSIDLFGTCYRPTNHLLPHDDQLEERKIAFILFLNTLSEKQGGALQLFGNNRVVKKIYPEQGSLALFEVSARSIHSIEEMYTGERWALTGWFHG